MIWLILIIFANPFIVSERCDVIELNHFHDLCGKPVYSQLIFWDFNRSKCEDEVRAWRLFDVKKDRLRLGVDAVNFSWMDADEDRVLFRDLKSNEFRETWTQVDPERANKKILDERNRKALIKRNEPISPSELLAQQPANVDDVWEVGQ